MVELDADGAFRRWMGPRRQALRTIVARGTYLDDDDIDRFLALSLPGVNELIGLVELERLVARAPWNDVVVDTAPTGHTLRLLAMPQILGRIAGVLDGMLAKHRFLAESLGGEYRADPTDALITEIERESAELGALLRDSKRCAFSWVLLPEVAALEEARDGVRALEDASMTVAEIIVNRVAPPASGRCDFCSVRRRSEAGVIAATRAAFPGRSLVAAPDLGAEPRGVPALRRFARTIKLGGPLRLRHLGGPVPLPPRPPSSRGVRQTQKNDHGWLEALAPRGLRLLVVAGKGGVGKTSCAAALALALAERDHDQRVLLLSVDPAHSLADILELGGPVGTSIANPVRVDGIDVVELDAQAAFAQRRARYRDAVDELFDGLRGGSSFDATFDRTVVQDLVDLAPSGLDEVFGIVGVIEALFPAAGAAAYDVVVLDTAPTGHALRLLEMPASALEWVHALLAILLKYRKVIGLGEFGADLVEIARDLRRLKALLGEPRQTRAVLVTRAAEMPRLETARLLAALTRLHVSVSGIVVNALTPPGCPHCRRAATAESRALDALRQARQPPKRCAIILAPAEAPPPRGAAALSRWRDQWIPDRR
ncbi:MAG: hypothetical protein AUH18_06695 [Candidatus Rokubacteria bacterium 13_2_20CM_69_10]|nr:MAG: hypothetical protein AUH18_06695 [Candidatus Rokubacteria bacterium 13_2_20CM_69_10]